MNSQSTISSRSPGRHLFFRPAIAWIAIFSFVGVSAICAVAGLGKVLNIIFPAGAFAVGLLLYQRCPMLYLGFTWWIWFLTPLIRRYSDFRSSYTEPSPILLAPGLVTIITFITFIKYLPTLRRHGGLPFILSITGVSYSFLIGFIKGSPASALLGLFDWLAPLTFGCHLFLSWRQYPDLRQNTQIVFLWCVLVTGSYGVFQYMVAPDWDVTWLRNIDLPTFGTPEPLGIRVWSTMHSPLAFACVMGAALLLLLNNTGPFSLPATAAGYLSFLLSLVRTSWLGWFAGLITLITSLRPKLQIRLTIILIVTALCIVPLATIEPFADVINTRVTSLFDLQNDGSGAARQASYQGVFSQALGNILGDGLGNAGGFDSVVIDSLMAMGWIGSICYFSGMVLLVLRVFQAPGDSADTFSRAAKAVAIGMIFQIPLGPVVTRLPGMILWGFLGLSAAALKHQTRIRDLPSQSRENPSA